MSDVRKTGRGGPITVDDLRAAARDEAMRPFGATGSGHPLSAAEIRERSIAGAASARARAQRHPSESTPSVRQGSTGTPSRNAISLFRQGQQRPDTRVRRSVWDTRSTEPTVGSINASFTMHFPRAVRSQPPVIAPPSRGRALLAQVLAAKKTGEPQDLVVTNPATVAEAQRHPLMRDIVVKTIGVVREHQKGTIERGQLHGLIPEGTRPGLVSRAYKHAALMAIHKAGLGDYDFHMDAAAKADLRPLVPFMRYAHRRVFDQLNVANKGRWQPFRDEFGQLYRQKKHGQLTGHERMRMRPNNEFIKIELGDLGDAALRKSWTNASGVIRASGSPTERESPRRDALPATAQRVADQHQPQPLGARIRNGRKSLGRIDERKKNDRNGHDTRSSVRLGQIAAARAEAAHGPHGRMLHRLGVTGTVAAPPPGEPPLGSPNAHIMQAARAVEAHFGVPPIGGAVNEVPRGARGTAAAIVPWHRAEKEAKETLKAKLGKMDLSFTFGQPAGPAIGGYNTSPALQLKRAIHPRLRQRRFRLRLNTQRDLRRVLNGGITRQERWQLGATTRQPTSFLGKRSIEEKLARLQARRDPNGIERAAGDAQAPTSAQAKAGNYRMGHTKVGDMNVSIETPRGKLRQGVGPGGRRWRVRMPAHYGYIGGTKGADGDHLDIYLGPHAHEAEKHPVFVVDQHDANTGTFDEHKVMAGFRDRAHATHIYDQAFSDKRGPDRRKAVHQLTFGEFRQWRDSGKTRKPYAELGKADYPAMATPALAKSVIGEALQFGLRMRSDVGRLAGAAGARVARSPPIAAALRRPRVAAAVAEARKTRAHGLLSPISTGARIAGAAVAGDRGAKIGGRIGLAADYAPVVYTAASVAHSLAGRRRKDQVVRPGTLSQQLGNRMLGKAFIGGTFRVVGAGARALGRASTRTKVGLALGAGAALPSIKQGTEDHPGLRAGIGALAGGAAVAALTHGRALAAVRRSTKTIYTAGLKEATREHLRVLGGGSPSPAHIAQQHMIFRAVRRRMLQEAKAKRAAGIAAIRPARGKIAAGTIAGAAAGSLSVNRNRWASLPDAGNP